MSRLAATLLFMSLLNLAACFTGDELGRMNFLLVADARKAEPPIPPQPSGRGFSSWFQAHSQSLSLTGLAVVLASGGKPRQRMRGVWRRAFMGRSFAWPWPVPASSSPSSYAAALVNPPTLDFLLGQRAKHMDEPCELVDAGCRPVFKKIRSAPADLAKHTRLDEKAIEESDMLAPTLLRRQVQCKGWTTSKECEDTFSQIPSVHALQRMYSAQMDSPQDAVLRVIRRLNQESQVGFQEQDAKRIYSMFSQNGSRELSAECFAVQMRELLQAFASCDELSLPQLRTIMATAFDRFDANLDGVLSTEEFSCALRSFNIELGGRETDLIRRFLAEREEAAEELAASSGEEQIELAVRGMKEKLMSSTGLSKAVQMGRKINDCLEEPGSPSSQAHRLLDLCHEELALATEISLTAAGLAMVVLHHSEFHADAALLEQMSDAMNDFLGAFQDLWQPICAALCSGTLAMAQKDSVALDVNEALLYARYFLAKGCSPCLFHKLITLAGGHWGTVPAGEVIEASTELRVLVRGKALRGAELVPLGSLHTEEVLAQEEVTYVAWDRAKLLECLESVKDPQLKALLKEMLEETQCATSDAEPSAVGPVDAVGAALQRQAKQRGLATGSWSSEGFCRIMTKPNLSMREKLDQCHAMILNCKDEILESLEALADLMALSSLLMALSDHTATLSVENVSQLAPLLVLLADLASKRSDASAATSRT